MFGLGYQELLIILVIVLVLFGASRLPDLARSLGSSVSQFKKGIAEAGKDEAEPSAKAETSVKKEDEKRAS
jgi:TatA/E family protein of Tat protein translocase